MTTQSFRLVNEQVRRNAMAAIAAAKISEGEIMTVCLAPEEKKRSVQQNRYLWGVVYKTIVDNDPGFFCNDAVDGVRHAPRLSAAEAAHELCKARFLASAYRPGLTITVASSFAVLTSNAFQCSPKRTRRWGGGIVTACVPDP